MSNYFTDNGFTRTTSIADPRTEGLDASIGAVFTRVGGSTPLRLFKTGLLNTAWSDSPIGPIATTQGVGARGEIVPYVFDLADAATADYDVTVPEGTEVIDTVLQKRGGAGGAANTVQVKSTGNAITDAMSINVADKTVVRPATIDDANSTIAAGGVLRLSVVKAGGNAAVFAVVNCLRR